jgi:hypothetical protein
MYRIGLIVFLVASGVRADVSFDHRLADARALYFAGLEGRHGAADQARVSFAELSREYPGNAVVQAYAGSLELLDAAHTWAFWDKHRLASEGLQKMDQAVNRSPGNLEARFIRAATTWHLPFFFKRKEQSASDFALIAPQAEAAAKNGILPPPLAAAALDYYGQVLTDKDNADAARQAFAAAVRVDAGSPAGRDAQKRLTAK